MFLFLYFVTCLLLFLLSMQIQISELRLLTGKYNYRIQAAQYVTYVSSLLTLLLLIVNIKSFVCLPWLALSLGSLVVTFVVEWCLSRISPDNLFMTLAIRASLLLIGAALMAYMGFFFYTPFVVSGLFVRNSPFGVAHGKPMFFAYRLHRNPMNCVVKENGSATTIEEGRIDVTRYGIHPNTGDDLTSRVQTLLDEIGRSGGGCLFFPRGRYLFNCGGRREFLKVNYSRITIEGETDDQGNLLTEFVNCGTTVQGEHNPWLSPFFITTGEALQPSNMFWGLNFRKPKNLRMESSSLSDPGSDGTILSPPFAAKVTADAPVGATRLTVDNSTAVGKYILLGMYNTGGDDALLRELLGVARLRPEWGTALRAAPEEAPSFQWLVEVKSILDEHAIELANPLPLDCLLKYEPAIFNVEMLEDIHIRRLRISSKWNGLFRHHGFPLYYSIAKTQEMDYGWNAINLKRAAHSTVEDVIIKDFTNPLYVQDSSSVTVERVKIKGYDGHQGLKMYCHTSGCVFRQIDFYAHFADMMGGEGNAYGNTFSDIRYLNPTFKPVDYDFHGFPEGPMSPPAFNLFTRIEGFRFIKGAGAIYNLPSCAAHNSWVQTVTEGERRGDSLFFAMTYRVKSGAYRWITAVGFAVAMAIKKRNHSLSLFARTIADKLKDIDKVGIPQSQHDQFFPGTSIQQIETTADLSLISEPSIQVKINVPST